MSSSKIVIVGTSCSGKTTLAQKLAARKGVPHTQLDMLNWMPDWTGTPKNEFHDKIRRTIATSEGWVICGNYNEARQITLPNATDIIWLNYPLYKIMFRGLKRSLWRIVSGEDAFTGCRETFRRTFLSKESILFWILQTYKLRRREYSVLLAPQSFPSAKIWVVKTEKDYQRILERI